METTSNILKNKTFRTGVLIVRRLKEAGFEAYFVGGGVRDYVLSQTNPETIPNDWDVTTNASLQQVRQVMENHCESFHLGGAQYEVSFVKMEGAKEPIEVATYRTEVYEVQGKPAVTRASSLLEDLQRRDFTINTLVMDECGNVHDYMGGIEDLEAGVIRFVGNPKDRILEDYSRMLRAVEFAARFGFTMAPATKQAIAELAHKAADIPGEMKGKVVKKAIKNGKLHTFLFILAEVGLLPYVFPELAHTVRQEQNPVYHHLNVFNHIVAVVGAKAVEHKGNVVMNLAKLFHDNKKAAPEIRTYRIKTRQPQDLGHEVAGADPAYHAIIALGFGKGVANQVRFLVRHHGIKLTSDNAALSAEEEVKKTKDRTLLRILRGLSVKAKNKQELRQLVDMLLDFKICDAMGFAPHFGEKQARIVELMRPRIMDLLDANVFYVSELEVTGKDLLAFGFQGKQVGEYLQKLVELNRPGRVEAIAYLEKQVDKK